MEAGQRASFRERGILHLPGVPGRRHVKPLDEQVADALGRLQAAGGKAGAATLKRLPPFQQIGQLAQRVRIPDLAARLMHPALRQVVAALAEGPVRREEAQLLLSPPRQGAWTLRGLSWHVDASAPAPGRSPGLQVFVLLGDVAPHGGATLAVAGSHLLTGAAAGEVRALLRGDDVEAGLRARGLSLVEMGGRAGDAYVMDMRVLHTPSINASARPRRVATVRCFV